MNFRKDIQEKIKKKLKFKNPKKFILDEEVIEDIKINHNHKLNSKIKNISNIDKYIKR